MLNSKAQAPSFCMQLTHYCSPSNKKKTGGWTARGDWNTWSCSWMDSARALLGSKWSRGDIIHRADSARSNHPLVCQARLTIESCISWDEEGVETEVCVVGGWGVKRRDRVLGLLQKYGPVLVRVLFMESFDVSTHWSMISLVKGCHLSFFVVAKQQPRTGDEL